MILPLQPSPNGFVDASHAQSLPVLGLRSHSSSPVSGSWSSIIGIVTAIVGNVLISFALNTQRLAHVRLEREAHGQDPSIDPHHHNPGQAAEDHQLRRQSKLADELSKRNKQSQPVYEDGDIYTDNYADHHSENETDPLLPRLNGKVKDPSLDGTEDEKDSSSQKKQNYLKSKLWWLGIILMTVGEAGNFLAYGFAPASIVSPLGVVALIVNCLIAPLMLHEKFRKRDPLGVIVAIIGVVIVVLSASGSNPKLGPHQIWSLISRWEFLTYFGITVVLIIILMFASNKYGDKTIIIDIGLVGLFGGYTALSTKGIASLLSYRLFQVFTFGISYLLVAILVGTAVMQIKYVNRALQRFDSTEVIPTQFCAFTVFVVAGSAILFRDFESMGPEKIGQFFGGLALTFLGVWIITAGRRDSGHGEDSEEDHEDEEQGIDLRDDETPRIEETMLPSPPATPKAQTDPPSPVADTPASFATATSQLTPSPIKKPPMSTTASSPLLPSQHSILSKTVSQPQYLAPPRTPSSALRPSPQHARSDMSIPVMPQENQSSTPASQRPSLSTPRQLRNSIIGMIPGPYTSPLSSGLSVVVADSRRRDERASFSRRKSLRTGVPQPVGGPLAALSTSQPAASGGTHRSSDPSPGDAGALGITGSSISGRPRIGGRGNTVEVAGTTAIAESIPEDSVLETTTDDDDEATQISAKKRKS